MNLQATRGGNSPPADEAHGAADSAQPIDIAHLQRYTLADRELEAELLSLFQVQAHQYLALLHAAPNLNAWREAAHTLKGSAMAVGAFSVAEAARRAEQLAAGPADPSAASCLQALEGAVRDARAFILAIPAQS